VPAGQLTHDGDPPVLSDENVPAGHMVQALDDVDPVFATKYPGWHLEQTAAPAGEYVPVAQVMHVAMAVAPRTAE
jgi:hypothetical protein